MVLPWVRLHATKDYLDMPLMAARHETTRVTFNLVPSLLDQLDSYVSGGSDPHLELSHIRADTLSNEQKAEILATFFHCNPERMIKPYSRYHSLLQKADQNGAPAVSPALFTTEEIRDLQVWSNLTWVDPMFRAEEPIRALFAKGRSYSEEDKFALLEWQTQLMRRIVDTYRDLLRQERIGISFTPYYHPILPLLCDTDSALESQPSATLPGQRFRHPEDAKWQIEASGRRYRELFDRQLKGMWPSEGSVSEEVARLCREHGISWIASDEEVLHGSLRKSSDKIGPLSKYSVYSYGDGLKLFFRDHQLSDRIGFVYSNWDADRAAADFISHLKQIRDACHDRLDSTVASIILDGENAWEYFADDGREFLHELYRSLAADEEIETVLFDDIAENIPTRSLTHLFAGSWINHDFRIWIGHAEDNAAWDLLTRTREWLVKHQSDHPDIDPDILANAWQQIYIAEGSDWCWWYGDDHRGPHNAEFDTIYRRHLMAVYELMGHEPDPVFRKPICGGAAEKQVTVPDARISPTIDGRVTHFYEWAGAGLYDCARQGAAMHRVERIVRSIQFGFDIHNVYIRLDFVNKKELRLTPELTVTLKLTTSEQPEMLIECSVPGSGEDGDIRYACDDILEVTAKREGLWAEGHGRVSIMAEVAGGGEKLETVPEFEAVVLDVPKLHEELFWPS